MGLNKQLTVAPPVVFWVRVVDGMDCANKN